MRADIGQTKFALSYPPLKEVYLLPLSVQAFPLALSIGATAVKDPRSCLFAAVVAVLSRVEAKSTMLMQWPTIRYRGSLNDALHQGNRHVCIDAGGHTASLLA